MVFKGLCVGLGKYKTSICIRAWSSTRSSGLRVKARESPYLPMHVGGRHVRTHNRRGCSSETQSTPKLASKCLDSLCMLLSLDSRDARTLATFRGTRGGGQDMESGVDSPLRSILLLPDGNSHARTAPWTAITFHIYMAIKSC